jgi:hypothetical protein
MISKNLKINVNDLFNDPDESKYEELMNEISTYIQRTLKEDMKLVWYHLWEKN